MAEHKQIAEELQATIIPGGITHPVLGALPETGCIPKPTTKTGTIDTDTATSSGVKVAGTSTLFLTELAQGDFLADADGVVRRIKYIFSNTLLEIDAKFPSDLSGAAVKHVPKNKYKRVFVQSTGTVAATLQEQSFAVGATFESGGEQFDGAQPFSYDVSTADTAITVQISK